MSLDKEIKKGVRDWAESPEFDTALNKDFSTFRDEVNLVQRKAPFVPLIAEALTVETVIGTNAPMTNVEGTPGRQASGTSIPLYVAIAGTVYEALIVVKGLEEVPEDA